MPQAFWIDEYRRKAKLRDPIAQSGRGTRFAPVEFLHAVREALRLLDLRSDCDLLDVGCANGLLDIVLSAQCRRLVAVEPVDALADQARRNTAHCRNVEIRFGHAADIPAGEGSFDRVLLMEVVQLIPPEELPAVVGELRRVVRPGGRIVLASVPDGARREAFLTSYVEGVRRAEHLTDDQKAEIIARNEAAHWHQQDTLAALWDRKHGSCEFAALSPGSPGADHRFHLILRVGGV